MKSVKRLLGLGQIAACLLLLSLNGGCGKRATDTVTTERASLATHFSIKLGGQDVQLQVAVTTAEMEVGLMNRIDLSANEGMVFVYAHPQKMSFWMRNTPTPLDIGYFSRDGILREVYPMFPHDETTVESKSDQIQFAVEMNQGWYAQHQVRAGAQLDLKALAAAVKGRGFDPKATGLPDEAN